jgi:pilus assembly protein CpaF
MNTGHEGSMSTIHCNSPRDGISRLETMVLMSGLDLPIAAIRDYIASALTVIVHLTRLQDGTRRITHVTEVTGMEGTVVTLQDIFRFDFSAGVGPDGRHRGAVMPTGLRPMFAKQLSDVGLEVPAELFRGTGME